jgi:hypothetical protein
VPYHVHLTGIVSKGFVLGTLPTTDSKIASSIPKETDEEIRALVVKLEADHKVAK